MIVTFKILHKLIKHCIQCSINNSLYMIRNDAYSSSINCILSYRKAHIINLTSLFWDTIKPVLYLS